MIDLQARIKQLSRPLAPMPTGEQPVLPRLEGIRAVVFDVYGTLLVSGSGDISLTSGASRASSATDALAACGFGGGMDGQLVVDTLHECILSEHQQSPHENPEVDIREVWRATLAEVMPDARAPGDDDLEALAVDYECRVNPIWPMPGLAECLNTLRNADIMVGIVSNAQFFTPLAFPALTGKWLDEWGFEPELCQWSFAHRQAKPGTFLYEACAQSLRSRGVEPGKTLYVGNDLRNDVWPAQRVGMRTALYAGDSRSLRWRKDDPRVAEVRPDVVVTELPQIMSLIALADT